MSANNQNQTKSVSDGAVCRISLGELREFVAKFNGKFVIEDITAKLETSIDSITLMMYSEFDGTTMAFRVDNKPADSDGNITVRDVIPDMETDHLSLSPESQCILFKKPITIGELSYFLTDKPSKYKVMIATNYTEGKDKGDQFIGIIKIVIDYKDKRIYLL